MDDLEELRSEWQESDSPAERNLREVGWDQFEALQDELVVIKDVKIRLSNGTHGVWEECGESIFEIRLSSVLTAKRCIKCQEQLEKAAGVAERKFSL